VAIGAQRDLRVSYETGNRFGLIEAEPPLTLPVGPASAGVVLGQLERPGETIVLDDAENVDWLRRMRKDASSPSGAGNVRGR
jgi:hypothetical protein